PLEEIQGPGEVIRRVGVSPVRLVVALSLVPDIGDLPAQSAQADENLLRLRGRHARVHPAVDQQQRSANAVEVENRRVLDVSLRVLPGWTAKTGLALVRFTKEGLKGAAVLIHLTVGTHPIGRTRPGDGGAEATRLGNQRQG